MLVGNILFLHGLEDNIPVYDLAVFSIRQLMQGLCESIPGSESPGHQLYPEVEDFQRPAGREINRITSSTLADSAFSSSTILSLCSAF